MERENLFVCSRCLMGIECREGKQATFIHYASEEDEEENGLTCDWCKEDGFNELYELI